MNADAIKDFMSRVVPWPSAQGDGYVSIHWHLPGQVFCGRSTRNTAEFFAAVEEVRPLNQNIYFCLSRQKLKGGTRKQEHAIDLKAIWLDIDVKPPPKGYPTFHEALVALANFIKHYHLPSPTAVVLSGSGMHVYWISDRPLSVGEWQPYANGLKTAALSSGLRCDAGVIADAARVLRVPGTKNFKTDPPKRVRISLLRDKDIDFAADLKMLLDLSPPLGTNGAGVDPFNGQKVATAFAHLDPKSLGEGIERTELPPLPLEPLIKECAFIRKA